MMGERAPQTLNSIDDRIAIAERAGSSWMPGREAGARSRAEGCREYMMTTSSPTIIDAHVHFWDLEKFQYMWPAKEHGVLFNNYYPCGYEKDLTESGCPVKNGIFVQVVNNTVAETDWVLDMATRHKCIVGVVGWIDMCGTDDQVDRELERLAQNPLFLGLRHILDLEEPGWIEKKEVKRTLGRLEKLNLTYDLLLRPHSLHYASDIANEFPNLRLIIDHLAKPKIKDGEFDDWAKEMTRAARCPNVYVKLSGLVTEADPTSWKPSDLKPFVQHCVKSFGAERCIFGSDYPVFKMVGATYKQVYNALMECLQDCTTAQERGAIFGENAARFYQVKVPLQE